MGEEVENGQVYVDQVRTDLVVQSRRARRAEAAVRPTGEGMKLPPVMQTVVTDDPPRRDPVVVVWCTKWDLGRQLEDDEGVVRCLEDDVYIAVGLAGDVGNDPIEAGPARSPATS